MSTFYLSTKLRQSLVARLRNTQTAEYAHGDGKRFCDCCKIAQEGKLVGEYDKLPEVAIFQLQLFYHDYVSNTVKKIHGHVPFPSMLSIRDVRYSLSAVVVHIGSSVSSGHYVAVLRVRETWILANDAELRVLDHDEVEEFFARGKEKAGSTTAYVLVYDQVQA